MPITTLFTNPSLAVVDYRCTATPADKPFAEQHSAFSLSYVRRGTFGCRARGQAFDLVPGAFLIGYPGDEFMCTHEHHVCGDECLSFQFAPDLADAVEGDRAAWRAAALPPLAELVPVGALAQAAADGCGEVSLEEVGVLLVSRFLEVASGRAEPAVPARPPVRKRILDAALRIAEQSHEALSLETMASWAGMSPFHFVRVFARLLRLTPHQYLIRCRLRQAARLLAEREQPITAIAYDVGFDDLSHFIRTFRRAAGVSPRRFREESFPGPRLTSPGSRGRRDRGRRRRWC